MLTLLTDLTFPVSRQANKSLMDNVVQLNMLDAGIAENMQRGLGLLLGVDELYAKTKGAIDYRGVAGHQRLIQDAETFCPSGCALATRKTDLEGAHLAIDFSNCQMRFKAAGMPPLPCDVNLLLVMAKDLYGLSVQDERRIGLFLDYLSKRKVG